MHIHEYFYICNDSLENDFWRLFELVNAYMWYKFMGGKYNLNEKK
jgi:hypothetical protein